MCLGMPGQIVDHVDTGDGTALVDFGGVHRRINCQLLAESGPPPQPGEWVVVHLGFAIERLDEAEAREVIDLLGGAPPRDSAPSAAEAGDGP